MPVCYGLLKHIYICKIKVKIIFKDQFYKIDNLLIINRLSANCITTTTGI